VRRRGGIRRARTLLPVVLVGVLLALLAACSGAGAGAGAPTEGPTSAVPPGDGPNVVLIMADDMSLAEMRYLPQTRRLLGEAGTTFDNFYAPQPLCCPSRAEMLTGQYAQNNGVRHNEGPLGGYQAFTPETALPVWLRAAGYSTGMVGKYLNGYGLSQAEASGADQEVGWDHWDPVVQGVYNYEGYTQWRNGDPDTPRAYATDYVTAQTTQLIEQSSGDRPFFTWASYKAPHGICAVGAETGGCDQPPAPAPRDRGTQDGQPVITNSLPSFNERDLSDKPGLLRRQQPLDPEYATRLQHRRAESLAALDRGVAAIVETLRRTGELDDTVLAFTSDNGYLIGQHRWNGKVLAYDESVRVPLLMRGPGIPAGVHDQRTAAMIDLAPTFAELAGATPEVEVDGRSLLDDDGGLTPHRRPDERTLLVQAGVTNVERYPDGWLFRGVRVGPYTYVRWDLTGFEELYDRRRDPYEMASVVDDPRYAGVRADLRTRLDELGDCAGQTCRADLGALPEPDPAAGAQADRAGPLGADRDGAARTRGGGGRPQ